MSVLQASDGAFCGDSVAHARTQTASPPQADAAAQSVARRDAGEQSDPLGAFAGGVSEGSHGGELERAMPTAFANNTLQEFWGYKYDPEHQSDLQGSAGINVHADHASVNLNFWITPDDANLDRDSGGGHPKGRRRSGPRLCLFARRPRLNTAGPYSFALRRPAQTYVAK